MATPQQIRRDRLFVDHAQMKSLQGGIIQVTALGTPPETYVLNVKVRTIIGPRPSYREEHRIRIVLPAGYPAEAPQAVMITRPQPFHPNWWADGRWCYGTWAPEEGLGDFVLRMVRTLQFDGEITNSNSPANSEANTWYVRNRSHGYFPCDRQTLPNASLDFQPSEAKKFVIHRN